MAEATRITIDSPIDHLTHSSSSLPNFLSSFRSPLIEAQRSKRSCVPLSLSLERISNCCIDIDWSEWVNFRVAGYRKRRFRSPIGSCVYMCLYIYIYVYTCVYRYFNSRCRCTISKGTTCICTHLSLSYIYIYIYVYVYV